MNNKTVYLASDGFIVPNKVLALLLGNKLDKFFENLTLIHEPKIGAPVITKLYNIRMVGMTRCVVLPRTYLTRIAKYTDIKYLVNLNYEKINIVLKIELYSDQQAIIGALMTKRYTVEQINKGEGSAILNLGAGRGKTMTACGLIARLGARAIYVVPKIPLAEQAILDIQKSLDNVTISGWKPKQKEKPDILVLVINTALNLLKDEAFRAHYPMIILDEVHMYTTEKRRAIFKYIFPIALGMSATTNERNDCTDVVAHKELAFGGIMYATDIVGDDAAPKFSCDVFIMNYYGPDEYTENLTHPKTDVLFCSYMYKQFCSDPYRMQMACDIIKDLYHDNHITYVFCEELDPLKLIYASLLAKDTCVSCPELEDIGSLVGGMKPAQIAAVKLNVKIILTTYGYSGTGISIQDASAIVMLTPRKSQMKQILARIMRRGADTSIRRKIYDIVDARTFLKYQVKKRIEAYEFYDMTIQEKTMHYSTVVL